MILRNNNIWHLSIAILVFLIFTGCSKQETIRPSIESYFVKLDTTLQLKPDKSVIQLDSILKYTDDLSDLERAMLLFNKGEAEYLNLKYENSFNTQLKSYELFTSLNDKYNEGRCLITLSGSSLHMGDLEASQVYALKALSLSQLIGNKRIEGKAYNQLFKLHYELKDYEKALSYIEKTDSLYSQQADTLSIIAIKNNKASIYVEQKEYNKALTTYSEAMTLSQSKRDPKILVSVLNNIGYTYIEAGKYDDAERFLRGAATLNKNINSVNAAPYKGLGNLFLLTSKIDSSWTNYNKALEIYKSNNDINEEIKVRDKLVAVSLFYGDYAKALNNQIIRDSLQLNLSQIEQENLLEFANVKYEVKQKETEINHQREINSRNRLLTISMVLLFVSLAVVTGVFVYNSRLRAANKSSKLEQSLLRVQMNPHFIFNTLAAIQNITLEGDAIKSSNYIAKFSKLIRQNFDYVRKESITLEKEISMISNYIDTQQLRFNNVFSYHIELADTINSSSVKVPPMLLQPFVENAIEYGLKEKKNGGLLEIKILQDNDEVLFIVSDNGLGRSTKAKQEKISEELHATSIFKERLKMRKKGEEKTFTIEDLFDENKNPVGTRVSFKLKLS